MSAGRGYAAVVQIAIEPGSDPAHRQRVLDEFVIPELRALPGYRQSLWLSDGEGTATCVVVFDGADQAQAGLEVLTRDGGPSATTAGIHQVDSANVVRDAPPTS
ncbi:MAG TPA: hypothetical protein VIY26_13385 [Acidimicrobiales bacterium]